MKKALSVFLMLALVGSVFAAEPVADVNVAEFSGNASVQWGINLDTMKTGFKNAYEVNLKLNLLNGGSKSTTGDGIWGELVIKTDSDSFLQWENGDSHLMVGDAAFPSNAGMTSNLNLNAYVDTAKLHFGPAYVGITRGNTQTGELKMDAAIRSSDDNQAKWLSDVGPDKYSQGIVAGFEHEYFNVAVDLRSYADNRADFAKVTVKTTDGKHTLLETYVMYGVGTDYANIAAVVAEYKAKYGDNASVTVEDVSTHDINNQYTNQYAMAAEVEVTPIDNLSIKGGVSYNFGENKTDTRLGFSGSVGYKFNINDTFYVRPQVGYTGVTNFVENANLDSEMAMGLLFGWGDIGIDANAGVPFLDGDSAKKVSPGVGVVAHLPLGKDFYGSNAPYVARIMPSFFSGEIVPNLTAAAYSDIGIMEQGDAAMAVAVGAKYAIPVGAVTITPNAGVRFANSVYDASMTEKGVAMFDGLGEQVGGEHYLNLKAGVDVTGLVSNTTFSVIYDSANVLNENPADNAAKAGTLNFKVKISL
ncbi:MAG: autotransporter [Candidatus Treponema excrementipullorum]|uniref:Autotransporter n=1 Tax=Candidatus Treponema excrementipullorum TaxID=2838768 RepID=A0A9E2NXZ5_9SPIR|nr:autotransporter [Candidatus Treponema excrementipullorum]